MDIHWCSRLCHMGTRMNSWKWTAIKAWFIYFRYKSTNKHRQIDQDLRRSWLKTTQTLATNKQPSESVVAYAPSLSVCGFELSGISWQCFVTGAAVSNFWGWDAVSTHKDTPTHTYIYIYIFIGRHHWSRLQIPRSFSLLIYLIYYS